MNRLLAAALVVAIAGCNRPEEQFMTPSQTAAAPSRPALDLEVPARLETATFAVG